MSARLKTVAWLAAIFSTQLGDSARVGEEEIKPPPPGLPPNMRKAPPPGMPPSGADAAPVLDAEEEESVRGALMAAAPLPFARYSLEGTVWKLQATYNDKDVRDKMSVTYKGQRTGWDSKEHDFDVKVPGTTFGYSVVFRDLKLDSFGMGNHFYKKFALLPLGETNKDKALYTVRMDTPHFGTGAKEWGVYKGYCKQILGGLLNNCHGKADATIHPIRKVYCSPSFLADDAESRGAYWQAGTGQSCSWKASISTGGFDERDVFLPLSAEFFADGPGEVTVEKDMDPEGRKPTGDFETYLFLTITTALKQAFLMGGSGN